MPIYFLRPHPDFPSPITQIAVDLARVARDRLALSYRIGGDLDRVIIPRVRKAARADQLWQHSCCEIFLGADAGYYEFNFSPSTAWAAYRFDGHRAGMRNAETEAPVIAWLRDGEAGKLAATIPIPPDAAGPIGLSAIVEDVNGCRSFWALAHPAGAPDFHDAACFAAQLPPAD